MPSGDKGWNCSCKAVLCRVLTGGKDIHEDWSLLKKGSLMAIAEQAKQYSNNYAVKVLSCEISKKKHYYTILILCCNLSRSRVPQTPGGTGRYIHWGEGCRRRHGRTEEGGCAPHRTQTRSQNTALPSIQMGTGNCRRTVRHCEKLVNTVNSFCSTCTVSLRALVSQYIWEYTHTT